MDDWERFEEKKEDTFAPKRDGHTQSYGYYSTGETPASGFYDQSSDAPKKKKKRQPKPLTMRTFIICLAICMILSAAMGAGGYMLMMSKFGGSTIDKSITTTNYNLSKSTGSELSIQEIAAMNEASVVAISTESVATDMWMGQYVTSGAGSGVVYSEDGYIITNNHVIEDASKITVTMYDGQEYSAQLVASDSRADVAVIKVEADNLNPVTFGDMSSASVGDMVVAIGNPLGKLSGTVTEGIISCLERELTIDNTQMNLIQTSASVNPGNSGGGLFDQYGNLIGLVVAKSSGSDVEGLGFAIPCDKVKSVAEDLISHGYVTGRPAAGVIIVDLTNAQTAMQYGVSMTGVYISEVTGKNAERAGLKAGDMIYYLDDTKITGSSQLINLIQEHSIGDEVTFTIIRDNEMKKISLELEDSANVNSASGSNSSDEDSESSESDQNEYGGQSPDSSVRNYGSMDDLYDFFEGFFN